MVSKTYSVRKSTGEIVTQDSKTGEVISIVYPEGGKKFAPLPSGSGRSNLPPIRDVAGRPLTAPVGSPEANRQMDEASRIYKSQMQPSTQQQAQAQVQAQAQIQQQVRQQQIIQAAAKKSTVQNYGYQSVSIPTNVYTEPTIVQRQTGVLKTEGKSIPTYGTFLIEPPKGEDVVVKETKLTPTKIDASKSIYEVEGYAPIVLEEEYTTRDFTTTEKAFAKVGLLPTYRETKSSIYGGYETLNTGLREGITEPTIGQINFDKARTNVIESTAFLESQGVPSFIAKGGEFISGVGLGVAEDVKDKPLKYGLIYGATAGAGFAVGAVTTGATAGVGAIAGVTAAKYTSIGLKTAQVGAGLYFGGSYAKQTYSRIVAEPTALGKGGVFGLAAFQTGVGFAGFRGGSKLWTQTKGWYSTRGREFIEIPQGEYPQANPSKQLEMFQKNLYQDLGTKPGAFHTTSQTFWKGGTINPQAGTSELPGIYGSTKISTPFARITGSGSSKLFPKTWQEVKMLFAPEVGKPGVAYLQPEGFRYSPAKPGKWFLPPKQGYADVPLIKSEIEAIFRPDAGSYSLSSKAYYTKINNVRVPIDSFVYDSSITSSGGGLNLVGGKSSYSLVPDSFILTPSSGISTIVNIDKPSVVTTTKISTSSTNVPSGSFSLPSFSYSGSSGRNSGGFGSSISKTPSSITSSIVPSNISNKISNSKSPLTSKSSLIIPSYKPSKYYKPSPPKIISPFKLPKYSPQKMSRGRYQVLGRRFGKFKLVGVGKTEKEAFQLGKSFASKTLGVTFKIPGVSGRKLPGYKTKTTKEGVLYIEPRGKRLKKGTKEIPEIQYFKKVKGGRKKKK